jgi:hypothetical protein
VEKYAQSHLQQPIADIGIMVPTTKNLSHYLELVKALSDKYKVTIAVHKEIGKEFLSRVANDTCASSESECTTTLALRRPPKSYPATYCRYSHYGAYYKKS